MSIKTNAYPVFLASITTAIGFLSLNFSDSPPFHILGNFVAFGVMITFVYALTLLPRAAFCRSAAGPGRWFPATGLLRSPG